MASSSASIRHPYPKRVFDSLALRIQRRRDGLVGGEETGRRTEGGKKAGEKAWVRVDSLRWRRFARRVNVTVVTDLGRMRVKMGEAAKKSGGMACQIGECGPY